MRPSIARVALPVPLDKQFDYAIPGHLFPIIGGRVSVPFGRQTLVGIVTAMVNHSDFPKEQLKPLKAVLDTQPIWSEKLYSLLTWCSQFYQYPLGDTLHNAMPAALRKGKPADFSTLYEWQITTSGKDKLMQGLGRAVKQQRALQMLIDSPIPHQEFSDQEIPSSVLKSLEEKGWIERIEKKPEITKWGEQVEREVEKPKLNHEQALAIASVNSQKPGFACYLLEGVTGSGKTEVYLNLIKPVLEKGKQALVLVPEIGLTPQTINRFKHRFNVPVDVIHSGLNDTERLNAWLSARDKAAGIIIGTRSALLTPFADLGIIIVDEEHDSSYKQQDSLRYHARDVAVMRAHKEQVPIVLGSATPALETLHNALSGKYHHLTLTQRALALRYQQRIKYWMLKGFT